MVKHIGEKVCLFILVLAFLLPLLPVTGKARTRIIPRHQKPIFSKPTPPSESEEASPRIKGPVRIIEGKVSSFSTEDKKIEINGSSYELCDDVSIFTQSTHLRRASLLNLEAAEEVKLMYDPRRFCVVEAIITRSGE